MFTRNNFLTLLIDQSSQIIYSHTNITIKESNDIWSVNILSIYSIIFERCYCITIFVDDSVFAVTLNDFIFFENRFGFSYFRLRHFIAFFIYPAFISVYFDRCHTILKLGNGFIFTRKYLFSIFIQQTQQFCIFNILSYTNQTFMRKAIQSYIIIFKRNPLILLAETSIFAFVIFKHNKTIFGLSPNSASHLRMREQIFRRDQYFILANDSPTFAIYVNRSYSISKFTSFIIHTWNYFITIAIYKTILTKNCGTCCIIFTYHHQFFTTHIIYIIIFKI